MYGSEYSYAQMSAFASDITSVSQIGKNRLTSCNTDRLHTWTLWRMSVNKDLIQGLGVDRDLDQQSSRAPNHTDRYLGNSAEANVHSSKVRQQYGTRTTEETLMGDRLYFLYGLPRVSVHGVLPDVVSSHYGSVPNLALTTNNLDKHSRHQQTIYAEIQSETKESEKKPVGNFLRRRTEMIQRNAENASRSFRGNHENDPQHLPGSSYLNDLDRIETRSNYPPDHFNNNFPAMVSRPKHQVDERHAPITEPLSIQIETEETDEGYQTRNEMSPLLKESFHDFRPRHNKSPPQTYQWDDTSDYSYGGGFRESERNYR